MIITAAVSIALGTIAALTTTTENYCEKPSKQKQILKAIFYTIIIFAFISLMHGLAAYCSGAYHDYYKTETTPMSTDVTSSDELLNFQDTVQTESKHTYLITFTKENPKDVTYYSYYVKTDYGYEYQKISPENENVYIRYCDENETPKIETETDTCKSDKILIEKPNIWYSNIFSYFEYCKYNEGDVIESKEYEDKDNARTIFYVPENSFSVQYDIDMQ